MPKAVNIVLKGIGMLILLCVVFVVLPTPDIYGWDRNDGHGNRKRSVESKYWKPTIIAAGKADTNTTTTGGMIPVSGSDSYVNGTINRIVSGSVSTRSGEDGIVLTMRIWNTRMNTLTRFCGKASVPITTGCGMMTFTKRRIGNDRRNPAN
jgi:hypothetical protein